MRRYRLGDLVPLLENPKRILQVRLFGPDGAPMDLARYCDNIGLVAVRPEAAAAGA